MTQTGERPPRFSIQVNTRDRVTRDYAYFLENRLRERYRLEGIPLIIDFVERNERRSRAERGARDHGRGEREQGRDRGRGRRRDPDEPPSGAGEAAA